MRNRAGYLHVFIIFLLIALSAKSYSRTIQEDTTDAGKERVRELVSFLQYALNTIGSKNTPAREKDVIITQSYVKFFRDADVQVEDDLDPDRSTVTNKDVQAYLKDIDFFFKDVRFEFEIEDIEKMVNENGQDYYLVKMNRNLQGVTLNGDSVNSTIPRFIEVNYNEQEDDLKIVSFYTTKLSEKEDLQNWWNELTFEWKYIFQQKFNLYDSVTFDQLKKLVSMDSLDLSSNHYIIDFEPLFKLDQLVYLNLSNTQISDLSPLRINNKMKYLDLSNTAAENLEYIKYASNLQYLNIASTKISELNVLNNFNRLTFLDISNCPVHLGPESRIPASVEHLILSELHLSEYSWLSQLKNLNYLDLSFSDIPDLSPLKELYNLRTLLVESTGVSELSSLSDLKSLAILNIESTSISDLGPLASLPALRKVYCDNSHVTKSHADQFMRENPSVLVIFDSDFLREWWIDLEPAWKILFTDKFNLQDTPAKDELARITQLDSLDISGNKTIVDLNGLSPLRNLVYLNFNETYIKDIQTISDLTDLQYVNAGFSNIENIMPLDQLKNLKFLNIESTRIQSLNQLSEIRGLKFLNIDNTHVERDEILDFIKNNPGCQVIYRTDYLKRWWNDLSPEWQKIFLNNYNNQGKPDYRDLHQITYLHRIQADSVPVQDLSPLNELNFLNELVLSRTSVSDLTPLENHPGLKKLTINESPVMDFTVLDYLENLEYLDLSYTAIEDISVLSELKKLKILHLSGTKIRNIKPLEDLTGLRQIDISNTQVRNLTQLESNFDLQVLVCYNTRINSRKIEDFQQNHPDCKVMYY